MRLRFQHNINCVCWENITQTSWFDLLQCNPVVSHIFCDRRIQKVIRTWQQVLSPYLSKWWEENCPWILTITVSRLHGCKFSFSEYCPYLGKMTKGDYYWFCPRMNWIFMLSCGCARHSIHASKFLFFVWQHKWDHVWSPRRVFTTSRDES